MKQMIRKQLILLSVALIFSAGIIAQSKNQAAAKPEEGYKFTPVFDLKATSVKNQAATGTCWCFATTSFIESELLRMGKGEYDLSEMFIVRMNYIDRLKDNYLRSGKGNTGPGSLSHDWMRVFKKYGLVTDEAYSGLTIGTASHNHGELQQFINAVAPVAVENRRESKQYHAIVNSILDIYLGKLPETFLFKGNQYTPEEFAKSLDIDPDDYVEITSFTHFPFYTRGILEVPDNWAMEKFYNVPIDELIEIIDYSFQNGYTVNWDGDVSESGFRHQDGFAVVPLNQGSGRASVTDRQRLEGNSSGNTAQNTKPSVPSPGPELTITQEIRQAGYENFTTTDDHLMHLTGIFKDQNGTKYYKTKNSWGTDRNNYGGYLHMSESFVRAKTIYIMVHKNAIPQAIKIKLGI